MDSILSALVSYIIGSVSFPGTYAKIKGIDLRRDGEGHLGATSIYRATGSIVVFLALGILDAAKGFVAYYLFGTWGLIFAMLGHMFPVFFGFRGGNAVSVYYGGLFAVDPILVIACTGSELLTSRIIRNRWRHAVYLLIRAVPAALYPKVLGAYAVLLLRHLWFYYVKFRQGSSEVPNGSP